MHHCQEMFFLQMIPLDELPQKLQTGSQAVEHSAKLWALHIEVFESWLLYFQTSHLSTLRGRCANAWVPATQV